MAEFHVCFLSLCFLCALWLCSAIVWSVIFPLNCTLMVIVSFLEHSIWKLFFRSGLKKVKWCAMGWFLRKEKGGAEPPFSLFRVVLSRLLQPLSAARAAARRAIGTL
jgi:hypothetical protein